MVDGQATAAGRQERQVRVVDRRAGVDGHERIAQLDGVLLEQLLLLRLPRDGGLGQDRDPRDDLHVAEVGHAGLDRRDRRVQLRGGLGLRRVALGLQRGERRAHALAAALPELQGRLARVFSVVRRAHEAA